MIINHGWWEIFSFILINWNHVNGSKRCFKLFNHLTNRFCYLVCRFAWPRNPHFWMVHIRLRLKKPEPYIRYLFTACSMRWSVWTIKWKLLSSAKNELCFLVKAFWKGSNFTRHEQSVHFHHELRVSTDMTVILTMAYQKFNQKLNRKSNFWFRLNKMERNWSHCPQFGLISL